MDSCRNGLNELETIVMLIDQSLIVAGAIMLAVTLVSYVVLTIVFRWLWNITAPEVFGLKSLTFWQALRILILASILFGGHRVIEASSATTTTSDQQAGVLNC